jgi:hypothetical protein
VIKSYSDREVDMKFNDIVVNKLAKQNVTLPPEAQVID